MSKNNFFCSRNSGNTHHCQSFSRFSPNSFSSLFSLILPVTYGFTDYYTNACPLEMQNGRCQSEISNGWRERKKMKSYFPCWWCLFCKSQTTVFHLCVHFSSQEDKKMEEQNNGVSSYFSQCLKIKNHKNSLMHAGLFLNGSLFKCPVFENDKILSLWRDTL